MQFEREEEEKGQGKRSEPSSPREEENEEEKTADRIVESSGSRAEKRLFRKLKRRLERGHTGLTAPSSALLDTKAVEDLLSSSKMTLSVDPTALVSVKSLQRVLMWLLGEEAPPRPCFFSIGNRFLLSTIVILLGRGLGGESWESSPGTLPTLSMAAHSKVWHEKDACRVGKGHPAYNQNVHRVKAMEEVLITLPVKRGDGVEPVEGGKAGGKSEHEGGKKGTSNSLAHALGEARLRLSELSHHGFPLPQDIPGMPPPVSQRVSRNPQELPAGRIAGVPPDSPLQCSLKIPRGFCVTRTAHVELHRVLGGASCPLLLAENTTPAAADSGSCSSPAVSRLLAFDCEMCATEQGLQLARVSALGVDLLSDSFGGGNKAGEVSLEQRRQVAISSSKAAVHRVSYNALVKPELPVTDYVTRFSGITAEMLASPACIPFLNAQNAIADLLDGLGSWSLGGEEDSSTVHPIKGAVPYALGHSLESDLHSLRVIHTRVLDTSLLYPHHRGSPMRLSLKFLAQEHLKRGIQCGGEGGHDSREDALAALDLVLLHLEKGRPAGYGEEVGGGLHVEKEEEENGEEDEDDGPPRKRLHCEAVESSPSGFQWSHASPQHNPEDTLGCPGRGNLLRVLGAVTGGGPLGVFSGSGPSGEGRNDFFQKRGGGGKADPPRVRRPTLFDLPVFLEEGGGRGVEPAPNAKTSDETICGEAPPLVCGSISLLGPPDFLRSHGRSAVRANLVALGDANDAGEGLKRLPGAILKEASRMGRAWELSTRRERGGSGVSQDSKRTLSFILAQAAVPSFGALEVAMSAILNGLPSRSLVIVVTQAAKTTYTSSELDSGLSGHAFFSVT